MIFFVRCFISFSSSSVCHSIIRFIGIVELADGNSTYNQEKISARAMARISEMPKKKKKGRGPPECGNRSYDSLHTHTCHHHSIIDAIPSFHHLLISVLRRQPYRASRFPPSISFTSSLFVPWSGLRRIPARRSPIPSFSVRV
ncbi:uncharacterized protein GGS25DRAFT_263752 [Hypoxylon fragiforme]|uniref:uncharacterized protein n=1 Tax=Hypoxylon fragiforme TaxID=63214 RepID=UPI0020C649AF|nr:uncharacterized protein GGS25DRAFT_263752 [Hypoxylon fragiforme]KAI2608172.1 hypothetical protein GGS25DRAFT_263752 [Hypoxylon fragiforme]